MLSNRLIEIGSRPDGTPITLPFSEINSGEPKVFIAVNSSKNGISANLCVWLLLEKLSKMEMKGSIKVLHTVCPEFHFNQSVVLMERLYRKIAKRISEIADDCEVLIQLCCEQNSIPFILLPQSRANTKRQLLHIVDSIGLGVVDTCTSQDTQKDVFVDYALTNKKMCFDLKLSGGSEWTSVMSGFATLNNVLVELGIIDSRFKEILPTTKRFDQFSCLKKVNSEFSGLLELRVRVGDRIVPNQTLAVIHNYFGNNIGTVKSSEDALVLSTTSSGIILHDDKIFELAVSHTSIT
ncbi:hypothetical protein B9Q13_03405 [Candidatus Marsarchaeota G2 archaeon ECH_B_SAG-G16]|jgi:hypothetical protein|uniref:Uncharacterized protein n=4 Tax=Candidatus Marsarchaeota TaxID=1978152 RepID=A0A2R6AIJ2_9ARCH|nr:MAG: hypothetical protein B9Q01_04540 [Candidatus Marsarchaeota G1 archaeon OSP_D]PSN86186.1 MAG: hypothetical protein B9Q02_03445 [Candidatus Marsarchaeota G1 archaeon BE_D]PSN88293.1 MAG: hypothetical protein B9Q00_06100 [Candidatus Marsarchaeota G1 archaeon OSP_C]PSO04848.1 MAG: hypothetical protein B9Q13_03405 [Candidatus Marsarchaeota G2 archaeon ECH_B_SAG-G16]